jgi:hypothetical protein
MSIPWRDCKNEKFYRNLRHKPTEDDGDLCYYCKVSFSTVSYSAKAVWKGVLLRLDYILQKGGVDKIRECDDKFALREGLFELENPTKKQQEKLEELVRESENIWELRNTLVANARTALSLDRYWNKYFGPTHDEKSVDEAVKKLQ